MKYQVKGIVFVPNEFAVEVEADSPEAAMAKAKASLNAPGQSLRPSRYIIGNSQDESSAFDYYPTEATPI